MLNKIMPIIKENWVELVLIIMLGILSPFFLFPTIHRTWIFLIIPVLWFFRWLIRKQFIERTILDWPILILVIQVLITCIIVPDISSSLGKISGAIWVIAVFYSAVNLMRSDKFIKAGISIYLTAGFGLSIFGILGMIRSNPKFLDKLYKLSLFIPKVNFKLEGAESGFHPNAVGGTLVLVVPLFLVFVFTFLSRKGKERFLFKNQKSIIFLFIGTLIVISALILTQSRASWFGLLVSSVLLFFPGKQKKWSFLIIAASVIVYLVLIGFDKIPFAAAAAKESITSRMELWLLSMRLTGEHPICGIGMNQFRTLPNVGYETAHVHNHLLHTMVELGIPGLVAYLAILMGAGYMCWKVRREAKDAWMRYTALGLGCGQLAHQIFGISDSIPLGAKPGIFFWVSLALIAAMYHYMRRERRGPATDFRFQKKSEPVFPEIGR